MGTLSRCHVAGDPTEAQDRLVVTRQPGVVDQPAGIHVTQLGQDPQDPLVQLGATNRRQGILNRTTEQLVSKRHSVTCRYEHPGCDADVHLIGGVGDQRMIGARRYHGNQLGQVAGRQG